MGLRIFKRFKIVSLLLFVSVLSSCNARDASITKSYLNHMFILRRAGDLHGLPPTSEEVIDRNPGYTSYAHLFDSSQSIISYQCKGTSFQDFYCEAFFRLVDIDGNIVLEKDSFRCSYSGGQWGEIIYEDKESKEYLGTIYVYTPYWCRWQFEYDVNGNGEKTLLTFEFWKSSMNPLPDFLKQEK